MIKSNNSIFSVLLFLNTLLTFFIFCENLGELRYTIIIPILILIISIKIISDQLIIKLYNLKLLFIIIFIIIILGLPSHIELFPHKNNIDYSYFQYITSMLIKIITCYIVFWSIDFKKQYAYKIIKYVLLINVTFFFLQFTIVYSTSYYIDPLLFLTGDKQRYLANFSIPIIGAIYRPTGFFEEPSTYAAFVTCLIACKLFINNKVDIVIKLSIASIFMSLSVAAIFYGFLLSIVLFFKQKNNTFFKIISFQLLPFIILFLSILISYRLYSLNGSASSIRLNLIKYIYDQSLPELLFGNGMLGVVTAFSEYMKSGNLWKIDVAALNDNGLWLFIIIKIGMVGLLSFMLIMKNKLLNDNFNFLIFIILLLTKLSFIYFGFIFYISLILFMRKNNE